MQREIELGLTSGGTSSRKAEHLRINIERDVSAKGVSAGFDGYRFTHCALPEIALADIDLTVRHLGCDMRAPILISCMTGGTPEARRINQNLGRVAQEFGFAMGLGSGRALIERPETLESFEIRSVAPDVLLLANLGAVQLNKGYGTEECRRLVEMLDANALVLHLNPLQEALQPEGDTDFRRLLERIGALCNDLSVPVIVKEVGWGIRADVARALLDVGVAGIDVAGAGGTSWSEVERYRTHEAWRARVAATFSSWGIPTAECIRSVRAIAPAELLIASGGVRDGLDAAKALALGADVAGLAGPFLRAVDGSLDDARDLAREIVEVLRVAMFSLGLRSIDELKSASCLVRV